MPAIIVVVLLTLQQTRAQDIAYNVNITTNPASLEKASFTDEAMDNADEPIKPNVEVIECGDEKLKNESIAQQNETDTILKSPGALYEKGVEDAKKNYKRYKVAGTASLLLSMFSPVVSLIPNIIMSSIPPKANSLNCPNPELLKNPYYYGGYLHKAKSLKSKSVWKNFWIGNIILLVLIMSIILEVIAIAISSIDLFSL